MVAVIRDGAVSNREDSNRLVALSELVDDSVGADTERAKSPQSSAKYVARQRIAFEKTERVPCSVDDGPAELEHLAACAASEDDVRHHSAGWAQLVELGAQVSETDNLPTRDLGQTGLDRGERLGVGQDLRRLLESVVLVDRDKRGGRFAVARHEHMVATISYIAQQGAQMGPKLANWHCLCHRPSVPYCVLKVRPASGQVVRRAA